jgi:hypothetical protein
MEAMDMGTTEVEVKQGAPAYVATLTKEQVFSMPGIWVVTVTIERPQQKPVQVEFWMAPDA